MGAMVLTAGLDEHPDDVPKNREISGTLRVYTVGWILAGLTRCV